MKFGVWAAVVLIALAAFAFAGANWLGAHWRAVSLGTLVAAAAAYATFRDRRIKRLRDLGPLYTRSQDTWRSIIGMQASGSNATQVDMMNGDWWRLVREAHPMLSQRGYRFLECAFESSTEIARTMRDLAGAGPGERPDLLLRLNEHRKCIARKREDLTRERSLLIDWWPRPVGRFLRRLRLI